MFLRVHQQGATYLFDFWGHTEGGKLTLGSGLFVGPSGIACDHHFNIREITNDFLFVDGKYRIEVFGVLVAHPRPVKLMDVTFTVNSLQAAELVQMPTSQLRLFWNADTSGYDQHIDRLGKEIEL